MPGKNKGKKNPKSVCCHYCQKGKDLVNQCKKHKPCKSCLRKEKKTTEIKKCPECLNIITNNCQGCFNNPNEGNHIRNPSHLLHSYCRSCFFNKELANDFKCSKCKSFYISRSKSWWSSVFGSSDGKCFFCNEVPDCKSVKTCEDHFVCCQCISLIFSDRTYLKSIECDKCRIACMNKDPKSLENLCSICFDSPYSYERIPLLTCKFQHICCEKCFKSKSIKYEKISCISCAEYFKHDAQHRCCILCKQEHLEHEPLECSRHYLCYPCKSRINEENCQNYANCNCNECGVSIRRLFSPAYNSSARVIPQPGRIIKPENMKTFPNKGDCMGCRQNQNCVNTCRMHTFCQKCVNFNFECLLKYNCDDCNKVINHGCKNCYNIIPEAASKILNPKCNRYKHFYCKKCFSDSPSRNKPSFCSDCKTLYDEYQIRTDQCILCKNYLNTQYRSVCQVHKMCSGCFSLLNPENITVYSEVIKCFECRQIALNYLVNPSVNLSLIPSNSIPIQKVTPNYLPNSYNFPNYSNPTINQTNNITPYQYSSPAMYNQMNLPNRNLVQQGNPPQVFYGNPPMPQDFRMNAYTNPQLYQNYPNLCPQVDLHNTGTQYFPNSPTPVQSNLFEAESKAVNAPLRPQTGYQIIDHQNYAPQPQSVIPLVTNSGNRPQTGYPVIDHQNYAPQSQSIIFSVTNPGNKPHTDYPVTDHQNYAPQSQSIISSVINPGNSSRMVCCMTPCEAMECNHPKCTICINKEFYKTYKNSFRC